MLKIGITGGIGSGKSLVCKIFRTFGVPVFNSDMVARELLNKFDVINFYKNLLGKEILDHNGKIDRKKTADKLFSNPENVEKINNFIHPFIVDEFRKFCEIYSKSKYVIKESAILFETGLYKDLDYTVLIIAPEDVRIQRVIERDKLSYEAVMQIIHHQWSDEKKIPLASYVLLNDGRAILPQIIQYHRQFEGL